MADEAPNPKTHIDHGSYGLDWVETTDRGFELWVCDKCHFIEAYCMHPKNSWNEEGTTLTCDTCGLDGT